jgi:5'-phosphate synthase pdxT subunit
MEARIGVLALQGSFSEHAESLRRLGVESELVTLPNQLENVHGLIIPGGESTTIVKLMSWYGFTDKLRAMVLSGFPIYGTCAGMILLAKDTGGQVRPLIGVMNITVRRNAFGRQLDSFEDYLSVPVLGSTPFRGIFIRAPLIEKTGKGVKLLAKLKNGEKIAAEDKNILVSAFHPELTDDLRMHAYFLDKVKKKC